MTLLSLLVQGCSAGASPEIGGHLLTCRAENSQASSDRGIVVGGGVELLRNRLENGWLEGGLTSSNALFLTTPLQHSIENPNAGKPLDDL